LMVQGQKIPTPNTSWLNQARMNRRTPKTRIGSTSTGTPSLLANSTRSKLPTLHEDIRVERTKWPISKLKSPPRSTSQWTSPNVRVKSLHRDEGMGTGVTKPPTNKELLSGALVEMLLREASMALEKSTSNTSTFLTINAFSLLITYEGVTFLKEPTQDDSQTALDNLSKNPSTLSEREGGNEEKDTRLSMTPVQHISAKIISPLICSNRSPEPRESLALSGKSFHFQNNPSSTSSSSIVLKNDSRNANFSITWPLCPYIDRPSNSRLNSSRISPTNYGLVNTAVGEKKRSQTNSELPPILLSRTAPLTLAPRQRRRLGGTEVTRLPSIYNSTSGHTKSIRHSTKLTLYHRSDGSQATLVQHSSTLPQSELSIPRPEALAAKVNSLLSVGQFSSLSPPNCHHNTFKISFSIRPIRPGVPRSSTQWRSQLNATDQQILFSKSRNYKQMLV
uniref:Wiskott-Aldrich syndrome protein family member n=1 Tax=Rodentolepis nana TaxID=102285 RepID=A0A0R3T5A4_RODNA